MALPTIDVSRPGSADEIRSTYWFPLDLGSNTQGHYMTITAFPSESKMSNNKDLTPIKIALFIPGGGQNSSLFWQSEHEYDEVKLTRLGTNLIGAIPGANWAMAGAAGAARLAGQGIINPKVQVLYANSDLRRFQFDFFMAPSSKEEADEMKNIIKVLRKFSSPEVTGNIQNAPGVGEYAAELINYLPTSFAEQFKTGFWFVPPAEFEIKFRHVVDGQQIENPNLPKIARCVLKNITVNYTQQGEFSTFIDGTPTTAQLTLDFREMRVISQQDVDNGY